MKRLFVAALEKTAPQWLPEYKATCERIAAVNDWNDPVEVPDDFLDFLIYENSNGISNAGMAFCTFPKPRPAAGKYRNVLQRLKEGLEGKFPSDNVAACRDDFYKVAKKPVPSLFNRIVAGFAPDRVSPVIFDNYFEEAYHKLAANGFIGFGRVRPGDDKWYTENEWVMNAIKSKLPDGPVEGTDVVADCYSRGVFLWGVHLMDMERWMIIQRSKSSAK